MKQKISGVPEGFEPLVLKRLYSKHAQLIYVVPNEQKLVKIKALCALMIQEIPILSFSSWDTVPYDRVAPNPQIVGSRIDTLIDLLRYDKFILIITISALLQQVPPTDFFQNATLDISAGKRLIFDVLKSFLVQNGYHATDMVMETGEFAVRGGLVDIFPAGAAYPIRVDFFGDEVDSIKTFDAMTQRTLAEIKSLTLKPMREFLLTEESCSLFRTRYRKLFEKTTGDMFYEAVSEKRYIQGLEHFLPLFHKQLVPLWVYIQKPVFILDFQVEQAMTSRLEQIKDYYQARLDALQTENTLNPIYQPIPPDDFFLKAEQVKSECDERDSYWLSPFQEVNTLDAGGRAGHDFVAERLENQGDIFDILADFIHSEKRKVILTAATSGSCQRILGLMRDRKISLSEVENFGEALKEKYSILEAPFEKGLATDKWIIITETDILGNRIVKPVKKSKNFITDITTLSVGDLVVHSIHGIGEFKGLMSLDLGGAKHDCICIIYDGGDKLFIPVENMDVLSRYGSNENVALDHLGSQSFSGRKERVKKDLFKMAEQLMAIASARALNHTEKILAPHGLYQEFCAHFPYSETDDQLRTISEIESDLAVGRPMDRLVCGDVGFGKTEVAMRAAFLAVMSGYQVAIIVPTTLLARQHTQNFIDRFQGFPVRIAGLSRLTSASDSQKIHEEMKQGIVDIVVGTHSLLAKGIQFKNLGLVIIDEEQHFGVAHKERLKELKQGVHVLTLTATPIPRTLQLSLSGVRELSVIATPPVDRLSVKTFVLPFDPVIIKEAILREHFRGGQSFFVCPRISDMAEVKDILSKLVPDIRVVEAHGQMSATKLENIMTEFTEKKFDVLLATSIIESGLDMPSVNTMIVYRADMFGLAALYQLRGRVGRGKLRAYAYLTTPQNQHLSEMAQKRLTVMQSLDSLGAGFSLASHDLDIRGAGNLLGQEQSGHIREVGVALYQKMLSDAIFKLRTKQVDKPELDDFSPQISIGLPVLIPESYIADLGVRMNLYHRMGDMNDVAEVESLRAELVDRFGKYPEEVENLLLTIDLKIMAKKVNIERLEAGPKGASIAFHNNTFPNPARLVAYINSQMGTIRIRPDQKLVVMRPWGNMQDRLKGVRQMIQKLTEIIG